MLIGNIIVKHPAMNHEWPTVVQSALTNWGWSESKPVHHTVDGPAKSESPVVSTVVFTSHDFVDVSTGFNHPFAGAGFPPPNSLIRPCCLKFKCGRKSLNHHCLVVELALPLWKMMKWVRQCWGYDISNILWKVIIQSCSKATNQPFIVDLCWFTH